MSAPRSNNHGGSQISRSHSTPQVNRSHSAPQVNRSQRAPQVNRSHATPANRNHSAQINRAPRANNGSIARAPRANNGNVTRAPRNNNGSAVRSPRPNTGRGPAVARSSRPNHSAPIARSSRPNHSAAIARGPRPGHAPAAVHRHAPVHRGPAFSRPYLEPRYRPLPSYHYGHHYFGHRIHTLPIGYSLVRVGYRDYYFYDGIYYRPYLGGGYYICRPPLGTLIASTLFDVAMTTIAINTIRSEIERARYAAELSSIYAARNTDYVLRTSDDYYNTNLVNQAGQDYYYQDGVFYTLSNGQYRVIEPPIGALVEEIPEDYDEIELGGKTYYQVEETLYKPTILNGKLLFEVACSL